MPKRPKHNSDHTQKHHTPTIDNEAIAAHLEALLTPAIFNQQKYYKQLGLRDRIINLSLMVAAVLTLLWRQVPGVQELNRLLAREDLLWCRATNVAQQSLSQRFLVFPAELFERVFKDLLPRLQLNWQQRTKRHAMTKKLELIERAISSNRYNSQPKQRRQANPYQQPQVELLALPPENLAPRLGLTPSSLTSEKEKLSPKEFISWTRNRDPRGLGWEFHKKDGLYHPVK